MSALRAADGRRGAPGSASVLLLGGGAKPRPRGAPRWFGLRLGLRESGSPDDYSASRRLSGAGWVRAHAGDYADAQSKGYGVTLCVAETSGAVNATMEGGGADPLAANFDPALARAGDAAALLSARPDAAVLSYPVVSARASI